MKKLAILTISVLGFGYGGMNIVSGQQASVESTSVQSNFSTGGLFHVIDDIEIPHDVLEYIQLTYDGHAVIKAEKVTRNGQDLYKLRVDRDDLINDANGVAILFDMNWRLVGTERAVGPPPTPEPSSTDVQKPAEPVDTEETQNEAPPEEQAPVGGRGSGGPSENPEAVPEKPDVDNSDEAEQDTEEIDTGE